MAVYSDLPVYEDSYQLFLQFVSLSIKMQRDFRYSLGEDIKRLLMSIIVDIYKCNNNSDNRELHIIDAQEKMVEVKIILRLLNDLRQLPDRHFALLMERVVSISRQLKGWENHIRKAGKPISEQI